MQNNAKVAGILTIVACVFGVFGLGWAAMGIYIMGFMFNEPFTPYAMGPPTEFINIMIAFYITFGVIFALIGVLGIIGGVFAIKKKHWGLALAGAIAGIITFFPCGIPAIIYITMSKAEFSLTHTGEYNAG